MGVKLVEVSWRLVKEICSGLALLAQFIGALCKFTWTALGEEHRATGNACLKPVTQTLS